MTPRLAILGLVLAATPAAADDVASALARDGRFSIFARALDSFGAASIPGERVTVFAPTDTAFERLPEATLDALLAAENRAALGAVVALHIVPSGPHALDGLPAAMTTAGGDRLVADRADGAFVIRPGPPEGAAGMGAEARIVAGDIKADGAVVHALDAVLLPPDLEIAGDAPPAEDFVAEIAQADDGPTPPLAPERGRPLVRDGIMVPSPEAERLPEANPTVIVPAGDDTLPPPPDPTRAANVRPGGATVPSPGLAEEAEEPATVIIPEGETVTLPPPPRRSASEAAADAPAGDGSDPGPVISLADLLGRAVRDEAGETVGTVADVLLSLDTRTAETVMIELDGGGDRAGVPAARITVDPRDGAVIVPRDALGSVARSGGER